MKNSEWIERLNVLSICPDYATLEEVAKMASQLCCKLSDTPQCKICGCIGNNSCGHDCWDTKNNCGLNGLSICPCCVIKGSNEK